MGTDVYLHDTYFVVAHFHYVMVEGTISAYMHRRYYAYPPKMQFLNIMSSAGATILAAGFALPLFYLLWSLKYGKRAGSNPWRATGLKWQTFSPPPLHNFDVMPIVTCGPYAYDAVESERIFQKEQALLQEIGQRIEALERSNP